MGNAAIKGQAPDPEKSRMTAERMEELARWRAENSAFITAYNQVVEEEGLPLESWRMF